MFQAMASSGRPKMKAKGKSKAKKKKDQFAADTAEALARSDLSKMVLQAYENEYAVKTSLWEQIERKAQGSIAIAGIMLAGGFAFARQLDASIGALQKFLLVGIIVTLLFAIWQCVKALKVTVIDVPPTADEIRQLGDDALWFPESSKLPDRVNGLRYDLLDLWSTCNKVLGEKCEEKAVLVRRSQSAILISALLIGLVASVHLWDDHIQPNQEMNSDMRTSGLSEPSRSTGNEVSRSQTTWKEPAQAADRTQREYELDRASAGHGEEEQRLSAARSFRPVR